MHIDTAKKLRDALDAEITQAEQAGRLEIRIEAIGTLHQQELDDLNAYLDALADEEEPCA